MKRKTQRGRIVGNNETRKISARGIYIYVYRQSVCVYVPGFSGQRAESVTAAVRRRGVYIALIKSALNPEARLSSAVGLQDFCFIPRFIQKNVLVAGTMQECN